MAKTTFKNILSGFLKSQPIFWTKGHKDDPALDIGGILDAHDNLRGIDCKGKINGIQFATDEVGDPTGLLSATLETIAGTTYLVFRDCNNVVKAQFASAIV